MEEIMEEKSFAILRVPYEPGFLGQIALMARAQNIDLLDLNLEDNHLLIYVEEPTEDLEAALKTHGVDVLDVTSIKAMV